MVAPLSGLAHRLFNQNGSDRIHRFTGSPCFRCWSTALFLAQSPHFSRHADRDISDEPTYALVAGAVTGGGLTMIANTPTPAGFILQDAKMLEDEGISPLGHFIYRRMGAALASAQQT